MEILDRYIGRTILGQALVVMLVLVGLFTFVRFLDELGDIGRGSFTLWEAVKYIALTTPRLVYELFPMVALLGSILGLSVLANDSELVVMRASGVSTMQIARAALKMGGFFVVISMLVGELVAPHTETWAERGKAEAMHKGVKQQTSFGLWMRDNLSYVNVSEVLPDLTLLRVKMFEFDENKRLRSLVEAREGRFREGAWNLTGVKQTLVHPEDEIAEAQTLDSAVWRTEVTPKIFSVFLISPDQLSMRQLGQYIRHLSENNQKTDAYELAFWDKVVLPLSTAVMVVLAIPFVFANLRSGTLGRSLFTGIMVGLGFYAANKGFGYVVLAYGFPPLLGAALPVIGFLIVAVYMLRRME